MHITSEAPQRPQFCGHTVAQTDAGAASEPPIALPPSFMHDLSSIRPSTPDPTTQPVSHTEPLPVSSRQAGDTPTACMDRGQHQTTPGVDQVCEKQTANGNASSTESELPLIQLGQPSPGSEIQSKDVDMSDDLTTNISPVRKETHEILESQGLMRYVSSQQPRRHSCAAFVVAENTAACKEAPSTGPLSRLAGLHIAQPPSLGDAHIHLPLLRHVPPLLTSESASQKTRAPLLNPKILAADASPRSRSRDPSEFCVAETPPLLSQTQDDSSKPPLFINTSYSHPASSESLLIPADLTPTHAEIALKDAETASEPGLLHCSVQAAPAGLESPHSASVIIPKDALPHVEPVHISDPKTEAEHRASIHCPQSASLTTLATAEELSAAVAAITHAMEPLANVSDMYKGQAELLWKMVSRVERTMVQIEFMLYAQQNATAAAKAEQGNSSCCGCDTPCEPAVCQLEQSGEWNL